jgi:hypothetical protein
MPTNKLAIHGVIISLLLLSMMLNISAGVQLGKLPSDKKATSVSLFGNIIDIFVPIHIGMSRAQSA